LKATPVTRPSPKSVVVTLSVWDVEAHLFELSQQDRSAHGVELHVHDVRHEMDHVDLEAAVEQAFRRFKAEQAAADHGGPFGGGGAREHAVAVVERPKDEDAVLEAARSVEHIGDRRHDDAAAGGEHERVVGLDDSVAARRLLGGHVDRLDTHACMKGDVVGRIPRQRVDEDVLRCVAAGEHAREQNAVVVAVRFVAKDGDLEQVAAAHAHVFGQAGAGHAVAHNDEASLSVHVGRSSPSGSWGSARTAQTLNSGILLVGSSAGLVRRFADCSPPQ
jgi:hypothetical protein